MEWWIPFHYPEFYFLYVCVCVFERRRCREIFYLSLFYNQINRSVQFPCHLFISCRPQRPFCLISLCQLEIVYISIIKLPVGKKQIKTIDLCFIFSDKVIWKVPCINKNPLFFFFFYSTHWETEKTESRGRSGMMEMQLICHCACVCRSHSKQLTFLPL